MILTNGIQINNTIKNYINVDHNACRFLTIGASVKIIEQRRKGDNSKVVDSIDISYFAPKNISKYNLYSDCLNNLIFLNIMDS